MDPLIISYDSDYDLIVEFETIPQIDSLKYKLKITRSHRERPLIYGNSSSGEYYLSKEQLDSILSYIMENK